MVYVRRSGTKPPLSPSYSGPFAVISRFPKYFVLDMGDRQESISVDRLKPHFVSTIFTPAAVAAAGLLIQWFSQVCHLWGSSVDTACMTNILVLIVNPPNIV